MKDFPSYSSFCLGCHQKVLPPYRMGCLSSSFPDEENPSQMCSATYHLADSRSGQAVITIAITETRPCYHGPKGVMLCAMLKCEQTLQLHSMKNVTQKNMMCWVMAATMGKGQRLEFLCSEDISRRKLHWCSKLKSNKAGKGRTGE